MSDETKGDEMVQGCRHDNVKERPNSPAVCRDCAVLIDYEEWSKLHPPPEPPKSWVRERAEKTGQPDYCERLMRETVEECCRFVEGESFPAMAHKMRRAMLEPKA